MSTLEVLGLKALVLIALLAALWGWEAHRMAGAYKAGGDAARAEVAQAVADEKELHAKETADLRDKVDRQATLRATEKEAHETELNINRAAVRSGAVVLRVPGVCPAPVGPAGPGATVADRPGPAQDGALLPETADAVLDAAGGSANDVRDYNALLDLYNEVRDKINATSPRASTP